MKPFSPQSPTLPKTEKVVEEILSLPMFPELTEEEVHYITQSIREFLTMLY
jgi:dTDP-4-amino-4,6-dideoxygalactose transaminase